MDPFVKRLVQRLIDPAKPLSRNRHFHTFDSPEGRAALRVTRRLQSLRDDLLRCRDEGGGVKVASRTDEEGNLKMELRFERIRGRRMSLLSRAEYELLNELPEVKEILSA